MSDITPKCCFIDGNVSCGKDAEWEAIYGRTTDEYTHGCEDHIGHLMDIDRDNTVHFIGKKVQENAA